MSKRRDELAEWAKREKQDAAEAEKARARLQAERAAAHSRSTISELKRELTSLEAERDQLAARVGFLEGLHGRRRAAPAVEIKPSRKQGPKQEACYFALASDWHVGERVRPSQVGYRNEYTPEIAAERSRAFFKRNLTMMNAARSAWTIDKMVLWLGGDFITGWLHEEYLPENFLAPLEEAAYAQDLLEDGIRFLLAESECAEIIVPTSNGNHGRNTKKRWAAGSFRVSYEFALYRALAKTFAGESRVRFQIAEGYNNVLSIYGLRVNFSHGDGMKYAGGVGGITVPFYRRIGRAAASGKGADLYCQGHFHALQFPKHLIQNGSLIGWNAYAEDNELGFEPPMQASFVIDSRYRVVSNANAILVERTKK